MGDRSSARRVTEADAVWIGALVALGAADVALARSGRELLTTSARRHARLTAAVFVLLGAHFLDVLGPLDPFRSVGRRLTRTRQRESV